MTLIGHINGVPVSGKSRDAFPSGHAVHIGALASALMLGPILLKLNNSSTIYFPNTSFEAIEEPVAVNDSVSSSLA